MPWRVSFFHQVQQDLLGGWSENYWNSLSDLSAVTTAATALRTKLFLLKGYPVQLPTVRISDVANFREVKTLRFADATVPSPIPDTSSADFVDTALLLKLTASPNYVTNQWLRGIYDDQISRGGRYIPTATFTTYFNAFKGALLDGTQGWNLRRLDRTVPKKTITGITAAGVVSCANHGLATDDKTRISRVLSPDSLNKIWKVVRIDADTFSIVGPPAATVPATVGISTSSKRQSFVFVGITKVEIDRATKHNTGRPFGQLSGRRSIRR